MKQVFIKYQISYPGFFTRKTMDTSEIVELKESESVADCVKRDHKKWNDKCKYRNLVISVIDYKVME